MLKKLVLIAVVLIALLAYASPALAQGAPGQYYVDTAYTGGDETGTPAKPYSSLDKAVSAAQNNPYGGYIYTKNATTGAWVYYGYVASVVPPDTGMPISGPALFALLAVASLGLIAGGWFLLRRSRTLAHPA